MFADLKFILWWWLTILILSSVFLPLTLLIFKKFWDKGYIFAKTIAIFTLSYFLLVLGIFKLLPFTLASIIFSIFLFAALNFYLLHRYSAHFKNLFSTKWKTFLAEEIIFLLILTFWSYIRGFAPNIEGLEKFMDWGFLNSILRSRYFPPADMWYAGSPINYYYFGHLVFALLTKISGISSAITYNLSVATLCSLTFVSAFSLASNLVFLSPLKKSFFPCILTGSLGALLLTFGGNLHPLYKITKNIIVEHQTLSEASKGYWYPDATRFIGYDPDVGDKTIHEFPIYSFVVADLHGHMNDIPLVIFFVAFLFSFFFSASSPLSASFILPSSLILSLAYMTNAWDFAVYGLLFAISLLLITKNFKSTLITGLLTIFFWFLFTLPFSLRFTPMAEGLRLSDVHSPFYQLFILYGGYWLISLPLPLLFLKNLIKKNKSKLSSVDIFVLSLIITATILIIIPEIIYLKDIYIYDYRRANTMFKLVYQAFIMYALCSGYLFFRFKKFFWYRFLFATVFCLQMIYSYFAIKSYYSLKNYQGLWGLNFLEISYPDNLAAINWLNKNVSGQPNMVEASGDSYTTYNQISMATGLPTIQGWLVHEWLWRGGYDAPAARLADVNQIYTSQNPDEVKSLLNKYKVKYIFVGAKEYEKYPDLNPEIFSTLGAQPVFESGLTKIYQLP